MGWRRFSKSSSLIALHFILTRSPSTRIIGGEPQARWRSEAFFSRTTLRRESIRVLALPSSRMVM
jgi:hypothetical protein